MYNSNHKTCHSSPLNSSALPILTAAIESRPLQPNPHHARSVTSSASLAAVVAVCNTPKNCLSSDSFTQSVEPSSREALKQTCTTSFLDSKSLGGGGTFTYPTRLGRVGCEEQPMSAGLFSDSQNSSTYANGVCSSQDRLAKSKQSRQHISTFVGAPASNTIVTSPQNHINTLCGPFPKGNFTISKSDHERAPPADNRKLATTSTMKDSRNLTSNAALNNRPRAVNYNELMKSEQMGSKSLLPDGTPKPSEPQRGLVPESHSARHPLGSDPVVANGPSLSSLLTAQSMPNQRGVQQPTSNNVEGSSQVAFLEGPLPPEVRAMIAAACASSVPIVRYNELSAGVPHGIGENGTLTVQEPVAVDEAERQARRLLSTSRRLKVYREELLTAQAEFSDVQGLVQKDTLVRQALETELADIDSRIAALIQERALCEAQFQQQGNLLARDSEKLAKAQERVSVLNEAIENMMKSTQTDQMMLRRLVPNLNIENYI
ncbi:unnamed protein product [Phytomonas sp. EM1]|nr:unnamed protein product [Phytomonas sp. EM1]|eukprot:CCW61885.1 unnamed protein product [Phytomonas sp. isolate EM1]